MLYEQAWHFQNYILYRSIANPTQNVLALLRFIKSRILSRFLFQLYRFIPIPKTSFVVCCLGLSKWIGSGTLRKLDYLAVLSLCARHTLLKHHSSTTTYVLHERQAPPTTFAVINDPEDDDDWEIGIFLGVVKVGRAGAKCCSREFQDSCCTKRYKVPGTFVETLQFATELDN